MAETKTKKAVDPAPPGAEAASSSSKPRHRRRGRSAPIRSTAAVVNEIVEGLNPSKLFSASDVMKIAQANGEAHFTKSALYSRLDTMARNGMLTKAARGKYLRNLPKPTAAPAKETPEEPVVVPDTVTENEFYPVTIDTAFHMFLVTAKFRSTTNGDYWRQLGQMCDTYNRMAAILKADAEEDDTE